MKKRNGALGASALLAALALSGLTAFPQAASAAARGALELCLKTVLPSLFPFMAVGSILTELGAAQRLSGLFSPITRRLFGVSGTGCGAFLLGLTGGYPLGAAAVCQLYKAGDVSRREAERLLGFCDNTGPAFIIGVAGGAVFGSGAVGLFLYFIHIASAVLTGVLLCWREEPVSSAGVAPAKYCSLPQALSRAVRRSVSVCALVCGFVVFFGVALGLLRECGALSLVTGGISALTGLETRFAESALTGLLELGSGICSMQGLGVGAGSLSLCSFILSFGGLSVHAQAYSEIAEGGLSAARHLWGKVLHGALSALLTLIAFPLFF